MLLHGISFLWHIFGDKLCDWACYLSGCCHQIDKLTCILFIQISEIRATLFHFLKEPLSIGVIFVTLQNKVLFIFDWLVGTCGTNSSLRRDWWLIISAQFDCQSVNTNSEFCHGSSKFRVFMLGSHL